MQSQAQPVRRRKKRTVPNSQTVTVNRGKGGYGFTVAGQHPCVLSCIITDSPAAVAGLRPGDYIVTVNGHDVWRASHDIVVKMVGQSTGTLELGIAHPHNSSDSSDEDYPPRSKSRYRNRIRHRQVGPGTGQGPESCVPYSTSDLHTGPNRSNEEELQGWSWGKNHSAPEERKGLYPLVARNSAPCLLSRRDVETGTKGAYGLGGEHQYMTMGNPSRVPQLEPLQEDFAFPRRPDVTIGAESVESLEVEDSHPSYNARRESNACNYHRGQTKVREKENLGDAWNRANRRQGGHGSQDRDGASMGRLSVPAASQQKPALPERPPHLRRPPSRTPRPTSHPNFHSTPYHRTQDPLSPAAFPQPTSAHDVSLASMLSRFSHFEDSTKSSREDFRGSFNSYSEGQVGMSPREELVSPERDAAEAEEGFSFPEEEEEEELEPEETLRAVVGYIGSIELPASARHSSPRMQSLCSSLRRLRTERKVHTMVLMQVDSDGVRLTRPGGVAMAEYPKERISFSGICTDDKRFFSIVTLHDPADDMSEMSVLPPGETRPGSGSCHLFLVEPELRTHSVHAGMATTFHLQCPPAQPPHPQRCPLFRRSATPITRAVIRLYQNQEPSRLSRDLQQSQVFASPAPPAQQSSSSSSNSDSGLGWPRGEDAAPVCVVDLPTSSAASVEGSLAQHLSSPSETIHNVTAASRSLRTTDSEDASTDRSLMPPPPSGGTPWHGSKYRPLSLHHPSQSESSEERWHNKLTPRAMPDPRPRLRRSLSSDGLDLPNSTESLRQSMHRLLQERQELQGGEGAGGDDGGLSSDRESQASSAPQTYAPFSGRPVSAPSAQLAKVETIDLLPPRAPTHMAWRSPSAPPIPYFPHHDISGDEDDETDDEDPYLQEVVNRLNRDHAMGMGLDDPRRYSENFAVLRRREKERREAADLQRWTKMGSFRRGRGLKQICHSHESLAVEGEEIVRLGGATSVRSVAAAVAAGGQSRGEGGDASRIAGWAVNFQRLLQDPAGRHVFTEFLKKEFSEENIIFWLACENFKGIEDNEERQRRAAEIYEQHLAIRALEPVNVDSQARQSAMELLDRPTPNMFDTAQMQIFQLMKQDSYARFLKSDGYKTYLMREMEGKPLDLPQPLYSPSSKVSKGKEDKKKKGKDTKEDKGKRRSILPWRQKDKKSKGEAGTEGQGKGKAGKEVNNNRKPQSTAGVDLAALRRETIPPRELEPTEEEEEDTRFCRVILPDGSTTVVCARAGMTAQSVLGKLCEKRGINVAGVEVFITGAEKPLDLNEDAGKLGSREVTIERRVLFRMDLPSKKSIGVKAKPNRTVRDVFRPILAKYGHRMDDCNVQVAGHSESLDLESLVSVLDSERVIVMPASSSETGRRGLARRSRRGSLEELTNGIFEALMLGKSHLAHSFDELGTVDLDTSKGRKNRGEPPSLGLFGGRAKRDASRENRKQKARNQVTFALQKNEVKLHPKEHDDEFFELLSRVQGQRLEDQRGTWEGPVLELPAFLQLQSRRRSIERSVSASDLFDEVSYMRGNSFHSLQPGHLYPGFLRPSRSNSSGHHRGADLSDGPQQDLVEHMDVLGEDGHGSGPGCYDGGASSDSPSSRLVDPSAAPELQAWSDASPPLPMHPLVVDMADKGSHNRSGDSQSRTWQTQSEAWLDGGNQVPLASPEKLSPPKQVAEPGRESGSSHTYFKLLSAGTSEEVLQDFDSSNQYSQITESSEAATNDQTVPQRSGFRRVPQSGVSLGKGVGVGRLTTGHTGDPSIVQAELSVDRLAAGIPAWSAPWQQVGRAPGLVTFSHQIPKPSTRPARDTASHEYLCSTGEESNRAEGLGNERCHLNQGAFQDARGQTIVRDRGKLDANRELASLVSDKDGLVSRSDNHHGQILSPPKATQAFSGKADPKMPESADSFPEHSSHRSETSWHGAMSSGVTTATSMGDRLAESGKHSKDSVTLSSQKWNQESSQNHQRNGASSNATYTQQSQSPRELSSNDKKSTGQKARESSWRRALQFTRSSRDSQAQTARDQEARSPVHGVDSSQAGPEVHRRHLPHTPSPVDHTKGAVFSASESQRKNSPSAPSNQGGKISPQFSQSLHQHLQSSAFGDAGKSTPVSWREQGHSSSVSSPHGYNSSALQHGGSYNQNPQPQTFRGATQTSSSVSTFKMHSSRGFEGVTSHNPGAFQQAGVRDGAAPTTQVNVFVSRSGPFHLQSSHMDFRSHQGYSKQIQNQRRTHSQDLLHPSQGAIGGRGERDDGGADSFVAAHKNSPAKESRHFLHNPSHESHPSFPSPNHNSYLCSSFQNGSRDNGESAGVVEETVTFV